MRYTQSAVWGRMSAQVLIRRARSLGYEAMGEMRKPSGRYETQARRLRDGAMGRLVLWWSKGEGWGQAFRVDSEARAA